MKATLARLAAGEHLGVEAAEALFADIMDGAATQGQIAGAVTAMRVRGETQAELTGAVRAMRARMKRIAAPANAIDVCGTGGDGFATLNVSTAVAFVVAACGVTVAKHGNRALSSRSGAADVLGALGVYPDMPFGLLEASLRDTGLAFLFAPHHHPGLRHAAAVRAELGFRTIFNLLGPLSNPAGVRRQLIGVFDPVWLVPVAETLAALGCEKAWVVHGCGLDELTLAGETQVVELSAGALRRFTVSPEQAGLPPAPVAAIRGGDPAANASALLALLANHAGPYRNTVLLNAAAALIVADRVATLADGVARAEAALQSGAAMNVLTGLRRRTQSETREPV
jgi:anthranilate phosphoribosyltransferase/anthranilate synthase/phosphoribosyltransferase